MKIVLLSSLTMATLLPISMAIAADCYSGGGGALESMLRKEEAVRLTTELNSKIMNALDKVLLSTDASRVKEYQVRVGFAAGSRKYGPPHRASTSYNNCPAVYRYLVRFDDLLQIPQTVYHQLHPR
jgi:hypothetical protein